MQPWNYYPSLRNKRHGFYRAMHYSVKRGLAIACRPSVRLPVCLSVTLVDHDHIGWKSWQTNCANNYPNIFALRSPKFIHLPPGEHGDILGEKNVLSTPTSITSGWIESTESHVILGRGVAVCLLLSAHRAVIFAIAQLSCRNLSFILSGVRFTYLLSSELDSRPCPIQFNLVQFRRDMRWDTIRYDVRDLRALKIRRKPA